MNPVEEANPEEGSMIMLQPSITNRLIKKHFPDKVITNQFKKQFTKALSLFLLFTQNSIDKKKYGKDEVINALQRQGLGNVAQDVRNKREVEQQKPQPILQLQQSEQIKE